MLLSALTSGRSSTWWQAQQMIMMIMHRDSWLQIDPSKSAGSKLCALISCMFLSLDAHLKLLWSNSWDVEHLQVLLRSRILEKTYSLCSWGCIPVQKAKIAQQRGWEHSRICTLPQKLRRLKNFMCSGWSSMCWGCTPDLKTSWGEMMGPQLNRPKERSESSNAAITTKPAQVI